MTTGQLLTTAEVAERLRMSVRFVQDEWHRGRLPGSKFGGALRFTETAVSAYIEAHANVAAPTVPRSGRGRGRSRAG